MLRPLRISKVLLLTANLLLLRLFNAPLPSVLAIPRRSLSSRDHSKRRASFSATLKISWSRLVVMQKKLPRHIGRLSLLSMMKRRR
jgi:hypothetical protein